jgi:hypothetical protein
MVNELSTFSVEDAFQITGRGWVLAGAFTGQVSTGNRLLFSNGLTLSIIGVNLINTLSQVDKAGLLVSKQFASKQELIDQQIIGASARILE